MDMKSVPTVLQREHEPTVKQLVHLVARHRRRKAWITRLRTHADQRPDTQDKQTGPSKRPLTFYILHLNYGDISLGWKRLLWTVSTGSDQHRTIRWLRYHSLGPHDQVGGI